MRFLADENFPGGAVTALQTRGHDIVWVRTAAPGSIDEDVLAWATRENRILLTFDKDFERHHASSYPPRQVSFFSAYRCHRHHRSALPSRPGDRLSRPLHGDRTRAYPYAPAWSAIGSRRRTRATAKNDRWDSDPRVVFVDKQATGPQWQHVSPITFASPPHSNATQVLVLKPPRHALQSLAAQETSDMRSSGNSSISKRSKARMPSTGGHSSAAAARRRPILAP